MRHPTVVSALLLLALLAASPLIAAEEAVTSAQALERLKAGNARFSEDKSNEKRNIGKERRDELAKGQHPFAVILTCADSRVAPELVFDTGLGDLFVLRVAGNVSDPAVVGSIEYAVEHLHSPLIVVMGHESCGAVKAAMGGGHLEGDLGSLINMVRIGKDLPKDAKEGLDAGIKNNVIAQSQLLTQRSKIIKELTHSKRVQIVPAVYSLASGAVEWLDPKALESVPPPPPSKEPAPGHAAHAGSKTTSIHVRVPAAEARVWIDSTETTSRGLARVFVTPALPVGRQFHYRVRVVWVKDGNEASREKTVSFQPGHKVEVDFNE